MTEPGRGGLGDFLRSRREKLSPEAVGLSNGRRRRTPGLRREEVAELADIGVDWYIRLEQGRTVRPSETTIDSLARALRLSDTEHAHLRALAHDRDRHAFVRETLPDSIRRMVDHLDQPAYVTGRRWDVLAWNDAAAEVFTDFGSLSGSDRNILVYLLVGQEVRDLFADGWAEEAQRVVAQFRAAYDLWVGDPAWDDLLARLRTDCPEFAGWWEKHDVSVGGVGGRKLLHHAERGPLCFEYSTFQANDDPALKLTVYTPV
jgi:transcriptional regulator with XRE-family HTH domain